MLVPRFHLSLRAMAPLQALAAQEAVLPAAVAEVAVQHTAAAAQVVAQLTEAKIRA